MKSRGDSPAKRIEIAVRRFIARQFNRPGGTILIDKPCDALALGEQPTLLLLRQDKIGDALISMPVIRALRQRFPQARIDILFGKENFTVRNALSRYINDALSYSKQPFAILKLLRELRNRHYDAVVDLIDNSSATSAAIVRCCGAKYAVGVQKSNAATYSHVVPLLDVAKTHIVERIAQLLLPFGIDPSVAQLDLEYETTPDERHRAAEILYPKQGRFLIGLNLSSASETRMWDAEQWIELALLLDNALSNIQIVGFASPRHRDLLAHIAANAPITPAPIVASFHEFAAILSLCDGIISPDTSVIHLAAAWKTPCVAMFVRSDINIMPWVPYRSPHRSLYAVENIREISVADVACAAIELFLENRNKPKNTLSLAN